MYSTYRRQRGNKTNTSNDNVSALVASRQTTRLDRVDPSASSLQAAVSVTTFVKLKVNRRRQRAVSFHT